jgi:hypothetical protein
VEGETHRVHRSITPEGHHPMAHGADHAPSTAPRADLARAAGCEVCRGWGTVVTDDGRHELCPACQTDGSSAESATNPPGPRTREQ